MREVGILLVDSCYRNQDKLWPDGPFDSYADLTLTGRCKHHKEREKKIIVEVYGDDRQMTQFKAVPNEKYW